MKRRLMLIPLVLLCWSGCQQSERVLLEPKADVEADTQDEILSTIGSGGVDEVRKARDIHLNVK